MRISLLISILYLVFAISLNAQKNNYSNNQSLWGDVPAIPDDAFIFSYGTNEKDTTFELIECLNEEDKQPYQRINIHWNNGIPRQGIIINCSGKQQKTVNYFPNNFNPQKGASTTTIVGTKVMSNYTELYTKYPVNIIIMDVLTGQIVRKSREASADANTYTHQPDTTFAHIEPRQTEPSGFFHIRAREMPSVNTKPNIVDYSHLDSGLYFMVIMDHSNKEILFLKTFRKGIK